MMDEALSLASFWPFVLLVPIQSYWSARPARPVRLGAVATGFALAAALGYLLLPNAMSPDRSRPWTFIAMLVPVVLPFAMVAVASVETARAGRGMRFRLIASIVAGMVFALFVPGLQLLLVCALGGTCL
jgi:hypothetical protein